VRCAGKRLPQPFDSRGPVSCYLRFDEFFDESLSYQRRVTIAPSTTDLETTTMRMLTVWRIAIRAMTRKLVD
jgi:hypothetical protein